jgi:hypothetical protein
LKSTPPFSHDPALIQFKYTTVKGVVYRFQEKSALKRAKHPSWIWRYGSECVRERHPESIYWSCDLCWDTRKGKLPDRVEIHNVASEKNVYTRRAIDHLVECHSFDRDGEKASESKSSSRSQS